MKMDSERTNKPPQKLDQSRDGDSVGLGRRNRLSCASLRYYSWTKPCHNNPNTQPSNHALLAPVQVDFTRQCQTNKWSGPGSAILSRYPIYTHLLYSAEPIPWWLSI